MTTRSRQIDRRTLSPSQGRAAARRSVDNGAANDCLERVVILCRADRLQLFSGAWRLSREFSITETLDKVSRGYPPASGHLCKTSIRLVGDAGDGLVHPIRKLTNKVLHQQWNILLPLTNGGTRTGKTFSGSTNRCGFDVRTAC